MTAKGAESGRYVVLDGLRGLAALCVITDHIDAGFLTAALPGRYLAVDFFFVLSGFVLSHAYGARLAAGMGPLAFMRVRLIRLYPLYLVGLLAGFGLTLLQVIRWGMHPAETLAAPFALNLLMLPSPMGLTFPFDAPAWSLFFELVANLAFAVFFLRLSPRALGALIALSALGLLACATAFDKLDGGWIPENFVVGFPRVFFGFFAGVLIHRVSQRMDLPALPSWAAYVLLFGLLAVPSIGPSRAWTDLAIIVIGCPALVALSAATGGTGRLERAMGWLGAMSYGVYVLHVPIIAWLGAAQRMLAPGLEVPGIVFFALVAALALASAAFLDQRYDRPVRAWLTRRLALRA
jgi:peptidoglycan/LPS O-acetylase OafA/YrhL